MRITLVTQSASRLGYGIFPSVLGAARALVSKGVDVRVFAGKDAESDHDAGAWGAMPVHNLSLMPPRSLFYAPGFRRELERSPQPDLLAIHGVWMAMHATAVRYAKRRHIPVIMTPHGSLTETALAISSWKKRLARPLYVNEVLNSVACYQALSTGEATEMRRLGYTKPIAVIPNGVDLLPPSAQRRWDGPRTLLYMGRLHTVKGIRELLDAWSRVCNSLPEWKLVIAGPDELGLASELEWQTRDRRVHFIGEVRGPDKSELLSRAHAFILPSFSEGVPTTVLEAWSYSLPVLMTDACNLNLAFEANAAFRITNDVLSLSESLRSLLTLDPSVLVEAGKRGRLIAAEKFSWGTVASELERVYRWVLHGGQLPPSMHTD